MFRPAVAMFTSNDVAQTFAKGQLGKGETKKLIEAGKAAEFAITLVPRHTLLKLVGRDVIHQLSEDKTADMHASLSVRSPRGLSEPQNSRRELKSKKLQTKLIPVNTQELSRESEAIARQ